MANNLARIAGGKDSSPHSWPSAALIRFAYETVIEVDSQIKKSVWKDSCGGVLLDRLTVITAAHVKIIFSNCTHKIRSHKISLSLENFLL